MTAVPPRPAACKHGPARCTTPNALCLVDCSWTAPDATAGDGLAAFGSRSELIRQLFGIGANVPDILALPALRDVLAAAARDAERVARVRELAETWSRLGPYAPTAVDSWRRDGLEQAADDVRRALDPS